MDKLDYIKDLGFDSIWLSPIYEVASIENGDDVINYMKINSVLGTDADFDQLLNEIAARGRKIILVEIIDRLCTIYICLGWNEDVRC